MTIDMQPKSAVRLRLQLDSVDYASYRAQVRTADGVEVWHEDALRPTPSTSEPSVVVTIPGNRLADGDYTIRLSGIAGSRVEEMSGYTFRVRAVSR
jgi:hypothetical protein